MFQAVIASLSVLLIEIGIAVILYALFIMKG